MNKKIEDLGNGISEITLSEPVHEGDNIITKIKFRNKLAWGDGEIIGGEPNEVLAMMKLFANLTVEPQYHLSTVRKVGMEDGQVITQYIADHVSGDKKKKTLNQEQ